MYLCGRWFSQVLSLVDQCLSPCWSNVKYGTVCTLLDVAVDTKQPPQGLQPSNLQMGLSLYPGNYYYEHMLSW